MKKREYKKISLSGMVILLWVANLFAQAPDTLWTKTYGGTDWDFGQSVQQTTDNGYIIVGFTGLMDIFNDVYLVKTDVNGDTLWTKTYGGGGVVANDYGFSVCQTTDEGYVIAGYTSSYGAGYMDVYLIKTDLNGDTLWTKTYGGAGSDFGYSVRQTNDGGYIISGRTSSFGAGGQDVYLVKTDVNGDTLWTKTYGGTDWDDGRSVQQTSDDGYIIVGYTDSYGAGSRDVYLVKTDVNGDTLWTKTYGGTGYDGGRSVQQTTDSGYVIVGYYTVSPGAGGQDVYLVKTDVNGDTLWTKTYGGDSYDVGSGVQQTTDDGYIIVGYTDSYGAGNGDVWLLRTDVNGDTLWTETYGGVSNDVGCSVQQTFDGGYILAGQTQSFGAGGSDVWLIKTDNNPATPFNLVSPPDSSWLSVTRPTFIWESTTDPEGIKNYEVFIDDSSRVSITDTIWTADYDLSEGFHSWYVVAVDSFNSSTPSNQTWQFEIDTQSPSVPALVSPVGGVWLNDTLINFEWTAVALFSGKNQNNNIDGGGAPVFTFSPVCYILQVDTTTIFISPLILDTLTAISTTISLNEDFYYWRVKAYDLAGNQGPYAEPDSFGTDITPPVIESTTVWTDTSYAGPFPVYTRVTDISEVDTVMLYYKRTEDPSWFFTEMTAGTNNWCYGEIPQAFLQNDTIKYYIYAKDILQHESTDPAGAPANYYSFIANLTGIEEIGTTPGHFSFGLRNSPARGKVIFNMTIPEAAEITLRIYDVSGRLIDTPVKGRKSAGVHAISGASGGSAGVYFYFLESPWERKTGKFVLIR